MWIGNQYVAPIILLICGLEIFGLLVIWGAYVLEERKKLGPTARKASIGLSTVSCLAGAGLTAIMQMHR